MIIKWHWTKLIFEWLGGMHAILVLPMDPMSIFVVVIFHTMQKIGDGSSFGYLMPQHNKKFHDSAHCIDLINPMLLINTVTRLPISRHHV